MNPLTDPIYLNCNHSFCLNCISKNINQKKIDCKICLLETKIDDIGDLRKNYLFLKFKIFLENCQIPINQNLKQIKCEECEIIDSNYYCENCKVYLCNECIQKVHYGKIYSKHKLVAPKKEIKYCLIHSRKIKYWCSNCKNIICNECLLQNHKNHEIITILDAIKNLIDIIQKKFDVENQNKTNISDKGKINNIEKIKNIKKNSEEIKNLIIDKIGILKKMISEKENQLFQDVEKKTNSKLDKFRDEERYIEEHSLYCSFLNFLSKQVDCNEKLLGKLLIDNNNEFFNDFVPQKPQNKKFIKYFYINNDFINQIMDNLQNLRIDENENEIYWELSQNCLIDPENKAICQKSAGWAGSNEIIIKNNHQLNVTIYHNGTNGWAQIGIADSKILSFTNSGHDSPGNFCFTYHLYYGRVNNKGNFQKFDDTINENTDIKFSFTNNKVKFSINQENQEVDYEVPEKIRIFVDIYHPKTTAIIF